MPHNFIYFDIYFVKVTLSVAGVLEVRLGNTYLIEKGEMCFSSSRSETSLGIGEQCGVGCSQTEVFLQSLSLSKT